MDSTSKNPDVQITGVKTGVPWQTLKSVKIEKGEGRSQTSVDCEITKIVTAEPGQKVVTVKLEKGSTLPEGDGGHVEADKAFTDSKGRRIKRREPKAEVGPSDWHYNEFVLSEKHFREECGLKGVGIDAWKENGIDTKELERLFAQKKDSSNGFVVPRTDPDYPWEQIVKLCQVVDGLSKAPVNGRMGVGLARGLYFDFKLKKDVNWAKFAHDKHLHQLRSHWKGFGTRPTEAPHVRAPLRYDVLPVTTLKVESTRVVEPAPVQQPSQNVEQVDHDSWLSDSAAPFPDLLTPPKSAAQCQPTVMHRVRSHSDLEQRLLVRLDSEIIAQEAKLDTIQSQLDQLKDSVAKEREKEASAMEEKVNFAAQLSSKRDFIAGCERIISMLLDSKKEAAIDLADAYEKMASIDNPEDENYKEAQADVIESEQDDKGYDIDIACQSADKKEAEEKIVELVNRIRFLTSDINLARVHAEIDDRRMKDFQTEYPLEKELHSAQLKVRAHCAALHAAPLASLHPVSVPTFIQHTAPLYHKISCCPRCCLGFHCNNWVPASCGHSYHPHCLAAHLQETCSASSSLPPSCLACREVFHPDWLMCWGFNTDHKDVKHLEAVLNVNEQRDALFDHMSRFYADNAVVAAKVIEDAIATVQEAPIPKPKYVERSKTDFISTTHVVSVAELTRVGRPTADKKGKRASQGHVLPVIGATPEKSDDCTVLDGQSNIDGDGKRGSTSGSGKGKRKITNSNSQTGPSQERRKSARNMPTLEQQTTDESPSDVKQLKTKELVAVATPASKKSAKNVSRKL